jgi:ligand-binding sensor domain-containing protein
MIPRDFKQILNSSLIAALVLLLSCNEPTQTGNEQKNVPANAPEKISAPAKKTDFNNFGANKATDLGKEVIRILQDKEDNYWFGTNEGVYGYDGKILIKFTTKDGLFQNQVRDIQEDESGNIWFSTGGYGVNMFDGEKITTLKIKEDAHLKNTPDNNWKTENGDLWFCAGGGAFRYARDSFNYLPFPKTGNDPKHSMHSAYEASAYGAYVTLKDRSGNIWFGTQAIGVCRYNGNSFTWFTDNGLRGPAVLALFEDRKGNLWFGNNGKGLFCYDGKTLTNITEEKGLSNPEFITTGKSGPGTLARVWSLNEDNNGNLWIGTGDAGAWSYDGKKLINYTTKDGLPNSGIETIYKDKKGDLWFGTNGDGVYTFNGRGFTKFTI